MRIAVVSAFHADSTFANVVNSSKMAQGFAENGHEVLLICKQGQHARSTPAEHRKRFALPDSVKITMLGADMDPHVRFPRAALWRVLLHRSQFVYARNYTLPCMTGWLGIPTAVETHTGPDNTSKPFLRCMRRFGTTRGLRALVTIAPVLRDAYAALGVPREKMIILPDAVDTAMFQPPDVLGESPYGPGINVVHCGNLFRYKGTEEILGAALLRPEWNFHLIGGRFEDIETCRSRVRELGVGNVVLHGHIPHAHIPGYLWHADVLVAPLTTTHESANWTSPMKLGEYMTARRPVVASDVPALRHWVDDGQVYFIEPDSAQALALGIQRALDDPGREARLQRAWELAQSWSFRYRARAVLQRSLGTRDAL